MATEPSSPPDDEFTALVARVRQGDESAAGELVRRYERAVLRCVRTRLGSNMRRAMDSMDVVQSVHRSLLIGLKRDRYQLTSPQQLIGLAAVMVQRKIARQWRKIKRMPVAGAEDPGESGVASCETIESPGPAPSEMAVAGDLLEQFLSQLDEFDQRLVHLKLEGHSSVETALVLGRDPAFVRMRWSRLRKLLKERGWAEE